MGFKIGISGLGEFGTRFVELFLAHPQVSEVHVADLVAQRRDEVGQEHGIPENRRHESLDELLKSDVDGVAIFSQRHLHAPQAIKALRAGKNVYSAVPAAITLDELGELVKTVEETGLIYMLGETSYYRPQTIFCREQFAKGTFGDFVYGEGHYYHDMSRFYRPYMHSGGKNWKSVASFPPILYPTHSVSHVLGVSFDKITEVSCFGYKDKHEDGIFDRKLSMWDNDFSNQTALCRTASGGMAVINEFRRIAAGESRMNFMGTNASYEEQLMRYEGRYSKQLSILSRIDYDEGYRNSDGTIDFQNTAENSHERMEDVSDFLDNHLGVKITRERLGNLDESFIGKTHLGVAPVHPVERLPAEFVGLNNGHNGSHQFLVVDFMEALESGKLPPNHVWQAARYNAPGIVAHESSRQGGKVLTVPDFGIPGDKWGFLEPLSGLK
jgi:predicted dehydrogenase